MVKLVVMYGAPADESAFDAHYTNTHVPLVEPIPGLRRFEHGRVMATPDGSPVPYYYLAELHFDDVEALQAGMASPEGESAAADVATFASGGATMMIAAA